MKSASEIRSQFLDFFRERDHQIVPSAPVVPHDDPTLLFTNAGHEPVQGRLPRHRHAAPTPRAADTQKCIRARRQAQRPRGGRATTPTTTPSSRCSATGPSATTSRREAIAWAWELLTERLGARPRTASTPPSSRATPTTAWQPTTRPRDSGARSPTSTPSHILLVRQEGQLLEDGRDRPLRPLHRDPRRPAPPDRRHAAATWSTPATARVHRDLEPRLHPVQPRAPTARFDAAARQARRHRHGLRARRRRPPGQDVATTTPTSSARSSTASRELARHGATTRRARRRRRRLPRHRRPRPHARLRHRRRRHSRATRAAATSCAGSCAARPASAARASTSDEPFIHELVPAVADVLGEVFPEIGARQDHIAHLIESEERASPRPWTGASASSTSWLASREAEQSGTIAGDDAFELYDTYGFPADLTQLMAREHGLRGGRGRAGSPPRTRTAAAARRGSIRAGAWTPTAIEGVPATEFACYTGTEAAAARPSRRDRLKLIDDEIARPRPHPLLRRVRRPGRRPGIIETGGDFAFEVTDTQQAGGRRSCTSARSSAGGAARPSGSPPRVDVGASPRHHGHHTATHLLHGALRQVVGAHANQQGSLVAPDRLRFDFTHPTSDQPDELEAIERRVNEWIVSNDAAHHHVGAQGGPARGIIAVFDEKYGDGCGSWISVATAELCGGTHAAATGDIGALPIIAGGGPVRGAPHRGPSGRRPTRPCTAFRSSAASCAPPRGLSRPPKPTSRPASPLCTSRSRSCARAAPSRAKRTSVSSRAPSSPRDARSATPS